MVRGAMGGSPDRVAHRLGRSSPHIRAEEHGDVAMSVIFGLPFESRVNRKLRHATLSLVDVSTNTPSSLAWTLR